MYRYRVSKAKARAFYQEMQEIENFCKDNNICKSKTSDSYYFTINGINYRVSNHSMYQSNLKAYNEYGEQVRDLYHTEKENIIEFLASKTRIKEIYTNLKNNIKLDYRGRRED